jgi:hypothetical protein
MALAQLTGNILYFSQFKNEIKNTQKPYSLVLIGLSCEKNQNKKSHASVPST